MNVRKAIIEIGVKDKCQVLWAYKVKETHGFAEFDLREYMGEECFTLTGDILDCSNWLKEAFSLDDGEESTVLFIAKAEQAWQQAQAIAAKLRTDGAVLLASKVDVWSEELVKNYFLNQTHILPTGTLVTGINKEQTQIVCAEALVHILKLGNMQLQVNNYGNKKPKTDAGNSKSNPNGNGKPAHGTTEIKKSEAKITSVWKPGMARIKAKPDADSLQATPKLDNSFMVKQQPVVPQVVEKKNVPEVAQSKKDADNVNAVATEEESTLAMRIFIQEQSTKL